MCLVTCHECIIQLQEKQELFCFTFLILFAIIKAKTFINFLTV